MLLGVGGRKGALPSALTLAASSAALKMRRASLSTSKLRAGPLLALLLAAEEESESEPSSCWLSRVAGWAWQGGHGKSAVSPV